MPSEPCLCGDPECHKCFPQPYLEEDEDAAYEYMKQKQIDDELEERMTATKQQTKAEIDYEHGQQNIEHAKRCLKNIDKYPESVDFYSSHFLGHIDLILFWAGIIRGGLNNEHKLWVQNLNG